MKNWPHGRGAHKSGDAEWYKRIHPKVVEDCCQLVKANSIKGNKQDNVRSASRHATEPRPPPETQSLNR